METLLTLLLESTLLLATVGFADAVSARRSAAFRHLLWSCGLLSLLALPVVQYVSFSFAQPAPVMKLLVQDSITIFGGGEDPLVFSVSRIALVIWAFVASTLAARLIAGTLRTLALVKRATPVDRKSRAFRLLESQEICSPLAYGVHQPVVLLPLEFRYWPPERLDAVLLHEGAHIARKDVLTQWLGALVRCLYWFQPLVWYAASRLRIEQEKAADDAVLATGLVGSAYASHLLAIAVGKDRIQTIAALPMAGSGLEARVQSILSTTACRSGVTNADRSYVFAAGLCLLASVGMLRAQSEIAGAISGTVFDGSQSVVPNALLQLVDRKTGQSQTMQANSYGEFTFGKLAPGSYGLEVKAKGFGDATLPNVKVSAGARREYFPSLQIGEQSHQVDVSAVAPVNAKSFPSKPIRLQMGGNVQQAKLIYQERPQYPPEAKQNRVQGSVQLRAVISRSGELGEIHVLHSPDALLTQAAVAAVGKWRYSPTHLNGHPVEIETTIAVNFTLVK